MGLGEGLGVGKPKNTMAQVHSVGETEVLEEPGLFTSGGPEGSGPNSNSVQKLKNNHNKNPVLSNVAVMDPDFVSFSPEEDPGQARATDNRRGSGGGVATLSKNGGPPPQPPIDPDRPNTDSAPLIQLRKPTRHENTPQKNKTWSLRVKEPILVLGDSNLSRIPPYEHMAVQVDSFPGAMVHHLRSILEKLQTQTTTEKVILSVGLNNCLRQNLFETIKKQFQVLVALARRTFPHAQIFIPLIQCSTAQPPATLKLTQQVNTFLLDYFTTLDLLEGDQFEVGRDGVHWTASTASAIFESWMKQLN